MAALPLSLSGLSQNRILPSFDGFRFPTSTGVSSSVGVPGLGLKGRSFPCFVVKAATVVAPKYTSIKPLGDRVLVKIKLSEEQTAGGILLPTSVQSKPQSGEIVAIGEGRSVGQNKIEIGVEVAEAEEKTAGGFLLTAAVKEKPSTATVVAVGAGPLDEEGKRKPFSISPGNTVLYSKYAGSEFKSLDGSDYIVLRASDVVAVLLS